MSDWINIGDINPKCGTSFIRNARIEEDGLYADIVKIIPETDVGGSDRVWDVTQGDLHLPRDMWDGALKAISVKSVEDGLMREGETEILKKGSSEYILELVYAANAYCGPENCSSVMVGIGMPSFYDAPAKFDGYMTLFDQNSNFWDILHSVCDGFDCAPEGHALKKIQSEDPYDSPYAGMPREIQSMADLVKIKAFRDCGLNDAGLPLVWTHEYRLPDHEGPYVEKSAHEMDTVLYGSDEFTPVKTSWSGPREEDLIDAWEFFYIDTRQPTLENDDMEP